MAKFVYYTEDHFEEMEAEIRQLKSDLHWANKSIESLESLRPHWAQGYSSDGVAAQTMTVALSSLWNLLGATNQTEAASKLRDLVGKVA